MSAVEDRATANAAAVWEAEAFEVLPELETVSVVVLRGSQVLLARRIPERGGFWQILTGRREPGEPAHAAAARELYEETGFAPALDEVRDLGYVHSFALDPALLGRQGPPRFARESAFAVRVPEGAGVRLDPGEHDAHEWMAIDEALRRLPFAGLRRAVERAAERLPARSPG
jgi:lipoyl(octanoyl) transferase